MAVKRPPQYAHYPDDHEFGKLVRDNVPQWIEDAGLECDYEIITDDGQYVRELGLKLIEECDEVIRSKTLGEFEEEVADVIEVLRALVKFHKGDWDRVECVRQDKANRRGTFDGRVYLYRTRSRDDED